MRRRLMILPQFKTRLLVHFDETTTEASGIVPTTKVSNSGTVAYKDVKFSKGVYNSNLTQTGYQRVVFTYDTGKPFLQKDGDVVNVEFYTDVGADSRYITGFDQIGIGSNTGGTTPIVALQYVSTSTAIVDLSSFGPGFLVGSKSTRIPGINNGNAYTGLTHVLVEYTRVNSTTLNYRYFINGVLRATSTLTVTIGVETCVTVSISTRCVDELRVTEGKIYKDSFTPPTKPYT